MSIVTNLLHASLYKRSIKIRQACSHLCVSILVALVLLVYVNPMVAIAQHEDQEEQFSLVPTDPQISPTIRRILNANYLSEDALAELRVFHGIWQDNDLKGSPERTAIAARIQYDITNEVFNDQSVSLTIRAEALILKGQFQDSITLIKQALDSNVAITPKLIRLQAEAYDALGQFDDANNVIDSISTMLSQGDLTTAEDKTEAGKCLIIRAKLRGESASYFNRIMRIFGDVHQQVDRLYWPAKLAEAELLLSKNNTSEAIDALHEVIALNPRCADAWYYLGKVALDSYHFDEADSAADRLNLLCDNSLLSDILRVEIALMQNLPDEAELYCNKILDRFPKHRKALAFLAAIDAVRYNKVSMIAHLDAIDALSPDSPQGYMIVGSVLSHLRQYDLASEILEEAISRQPNWAAPYIELGLLKLQSGHDASALQYLRRATMLDPYNDRAVFSLHLLESLATYEILESDHFKVRFDPNSTDRALANEMLEPLEIMYEEVTSIFDHEPQQKTLIELMPNHKRFAVRITGIPAIHTIAAATGPVIAMESPREGTDHYGPYDWRRVLRHEFVHTVTLSSTHNRIPHWFTEAAAVWQELAPRDYSKCLRLARRYKSDNLFDLTEVNWAFVRPQKKGDRGFAYAQSHWMFEYIIETFGRRSMIELLESYRAGFSEPLAMSTALGVSSDEFLDGFHLWAGMQIKQWGLSPTPSMHTLILQASKTNEPLHKIATEQASNIVKNINGDFLQSMFTILDPASTQQKRNTLKRMLRNWGEQGVRISVDMVPSMVITDLLEQYPNHSALLEIAVHRRLDAVGMDDITVDLLRRYNHARPVDPLPHIKLAQYYLLDPQTEAQAIPHFEALVGHEQSSGAIAMDLTRLYRNEKEYNIAYKHAEKSLSIEPFNATYREIAAAIAIQAKKFDAAKKHLTALTILEPDRPIHLKRIAALDKLITQHDQ